MRKTLIALIVIWSILICISIWSLSRQFNNFEKNYTEAKEILSLIFKKVETPIVVVCSQVEETLECYQDWDVIINEDNNGN